jgi:hypothetical protein
VSLNLRAYYANSSGEGHAENPYRHQDRFTSRTVRAVRKLIHKESSALDIVVACQFSLPIHVQMASTSHCADDAIFPSPFTSTIPARPGVYLDKEAKKKNQGRRSLSLNLVSKPTNLNQRAKQECRINQANKQKLFRVSKSKNHHRKASKQASKKEAKTCKTQAKGNLLPLQVLPTQTPGKNQSIHPHTSRTLFEKKYSQISSPSPN